MAQRRIYSPRPAERIMYGFRSLRSSDEITSRILILAKDGSGKTRLMYLSNLGYSQMMDHLNRLIRQGLIREEYGPNMRSKRFKTTEEGHNFLRALKEIQEIIQEPEAT
ncbi:MAG: winged helix-turn-helix domain-containing protein [archaeon]|nr:winged helix-turn-helix domain-containing protein [archaeon]